jgi:hypothetical protein
VLSVNQPQVLPDHQRSVLSRPEGIYSGQYQRNIQGQHQYGNQQPDDHDDDSAAGGVGACETEGED